MRLPGVTVSDSILDSRLSESSSAVPVFIGYTSGGPVGQLYALDTLQDYPRIGEEPYARPSTRGTTHSLYSTVRHYFDNGGGRCFVLSVGNFASVPEKAAALVTALSATALLSAVAEETAITLLAVPDLTLFAETEATNIADVWKAWLRLNLLRPDIFCILDMPLSAEAAGKCLKALGPKPDGAAFGAVYWPRLVVDYADNPAGGQALVPPSGAVAAVFYRTDQERGIWKAPANVRLSHTLAPEHDHHEGAALLQSALVPFNLLHAFPGRGVRVWGCRTLSRDPAWCHIQIRRLVSHIEVNLSEIGRFVVFEPNNEITWLKFKGLARAWLRKLWLSGGLFGAEESEAFRIDLGLGESMAPTDVDEGRLIMKVRVAALQPAEFIDVHLLFHLGESAPDPRIAHADRSAFL